VTFAYHLDGSGFPARNDQVLLIAATAALVVACFGLAVVLLRAGVAADRASARGRREAGDEAPRGGS